MRTFYSSQRGAMFGLDARIALAIVAGTSVITGVSMMQSSVGARASALEQELSNFSTIISNAQEAWGHSPLYFLKTIHKTPTITEAQQASNIAYSFMDSSVFSTRPAKWVGPYFTKLKTRSISANVKEVYSVEYDTLSVFIKKDTAATTTADLIPTACSTSDRRNCYYWYQYKSVALAIAQHLDKTIDDDDQLTGAVRYGAATDGKTALYYQGPRVLP